MGKTICIILSLLFIVSCGYDEETIQKIKQMKEKTTISSTNSKHPSTILQTQTNKPDNKRDFLKKCLHEHFFNDLNLDWDCMVDKFSLRLPEETVEETIHNCKNNPQKVTEDNFSDIFLTQLLLECSGIIMNRHRSDEIDY